VSDVPVGWIVAKMGDVFDLYQPQTISMSKLAPDGPYPVFGANGIIGRYHSFNHANPEVLVTCRGATCGTVNVSMPNSWITGNAMVVHPVGNWCSPSFLYHLLSSLNFAKAISGTAIPQITRKSLSPIEVPVPPAAEQERIVAAIEEQFSRIDAGVAALERARQNLNRMRSQGVSSLFDPLWPRVPMADVLTLISDCPHRTPKYTDGEGYPALRPRDVVGGELRLETSAKVSAQEYRLQTIRHTPEAGDIVYSRELSGPWSFPKSRRSAFRRVW
jgi:hypothetical protein